MKGTHETNIVTYFLMSKLPFFVLATNFFNLFIFWIYSFKNNTSFVSRFNTLRRARSSALHSPVGSHHGPHHSSSNELQASDMSADNISTSGHHGDESSSIGGGPETRISKKGSDGELFIVNLSVTLTMPNRFLCNYLLMPI